MWGENREALIVHARSALVGKPTRFGPGHTTDRYCYREMNRETKQIGGSRCIEVHYIGHGPPGVSTFAGDNPLEGERYDLFADWNIHDNRYERVWASFPRLRGDVETVDLNEALEPA